MQNLTPAKEHIIVGLSGGVDSAVAAYLLKKAGHHVSAIFMKNWEGDDTETFCGANLDYQAAVAVALHLNIELHLVNFADEYWQQVFTHFLAEYRNGRTPNPDILCNKEIKFKAFLAYAKQRGATKIATGHYVQTQRTAAHTFLKKGLDDTKDQSYFLYALNEMQLQESVFPVGGLNKSAVRAIAKDIALPNHARKDSTGICFIGERKFKSFLTEYLPAKRGAIVTLSGETLGEHDGLMFYTIGQRQGLCIGGKKDKLAAPWYVVAKNIPENKLVVVQGEHPALYQTTLLITDLHWINKPQALPLKVQAKARYRQKEEPCLISALNDTHTRVTFDNPQRAITPGQAIVFYQDAICLGGGIIDQ